MVVARHVAEGDRIEAGDVLLELRAETLDAQLRQIQTALSELNSRLRPQAAAELERASIELTQAERETKRRYELWQVALLAEEAYEQAQRLERLARVNLSNARLQVSALAIRGTEEQRFQAELAALQAQREKATLRASAAGTILTRHIETGDIAQPGQTLFTVALDGVLEVRAQLDERNLALLALQQDAKIIADAYPEQPFPAVITFIAPAIDPERATGASQSQILRIFLLQGALFGLFGSVVGVAASYALVWIFNTFGPGLFFIPVAQSLIVSAVSLATVTGVIAAAIPARRAAQLDPVEAIRYV